MRFISNIAQFISLNLTVFFKIIEILLTLFDKKDLPSADLKMDSKRGIWSLIL